MSPIAVSWRGQPTRDTHALEQSNQRRQHETEQNSQGYRYDDLTTEIQYHYNDCSKDRRCHCAQQGNQFFRFSRFESCLITAPRYAGKAADCLTLAFLAGSDGISLETSFIADIIEFVAV